MKKTTKQFLSFVVAITALTSASTLANASNDNTEPVEILDTDTGYTTYTVKKGDTLGNIAKKYYGDAYFYNQLAAYNGIADPAKIYPGQVLIIPSDFNVYYDYDANTVVVPEDYDYAQDAAYTVQCGDSLDIIVLSMYGRNDRCIVDRVATYNGLPDPNKIVVGQILYFPSLERVLMIDPNDYSAEYAEMAAKFREMYKCRKHCKPSGCPTIPYPAGCIPVIPDYSNCNCNCNCLSLKPGCNN